MIEHIDIIEALGDQITSLLDLIACTDGDCVDVQSIKTASEMCMTMHLEIMEEVDKMSREIKGGDYIEQKQGE